MSSIVFRKNGGFYSVYGDDTYIIYYFFDYKIIDNRVGFPIGSINKIINKLNDNNINYENIVDNENINFKSKNNYNKFVDLGKRKYSVDNRINNIISRLNNLDEKSVDEILNYIEEKL